MESIVLQSWGQANCCQEVGQTWKDMGRLYAELAKYHMWQEGH